MMVQLEQLEMRKIKNCSSQYSWLVATWGGLLFESPETKLRRKFLMGDVLDVIASNSFHQGFVVHFQRIQWSNCEWKRCQAWWCPFQLDHRAQYRYHRSHEMRGRRREVLCRTWRREEGIQIFQHLLACHWHALNVSLLKIFNKNYHLLRLLSVQWPILIRLEDGSNTSPCHAQMESKGIAAGL